MAQSKSQKAEIPTASEAPVVGGIAAVRHYVAMRDKMPLLNLGGSVHAIHGGTEFGAELSFEDLKSLLASHDALVKALTDWLEYAEEQLSEFDYEECIIREEFDLCPKCRSNGCINLKIRNARALLLSARGVQ